MLREGMKGHLVLLNQLEKKRIDAINDEQVSHQMLFYICVANLSIRNGKVTQVENT
jgi:hypothetical protein